MLPQLMLITALALLLAIVAHAIFELQEQTAVARTSIERQSAALARNLAIASAGPTQRACHPAASGAGPSTGWGNAACTGGVVIVADCRNCALVNAGGYAILAGT